MESVGMDDPRVLAEDRTAFWPALLFLMLCIALVFGPTMVQRLCIHERARVMMRSEESSGARAVPAPPLPSSPR